MKILILISLSLMIIMIRKCLAAKSIADQIKEIVCQNKKQNEMWNKGMMCCQSINCYHLVSKWFTNYQFFNHNLLRVTIKNKETELNNETRTALYNNIILDEDTRKKGCSNAKQYLDKLKDITIDLRGELKEKCSDEKGVEELMNLKVVSN